jgi:hypothetical protein
MGAAREAGRLRERSLSLTLAQQLPLSACEAVIERRAWDESTRRTFKQARNSNRLGEYLLHASHRSMYGGAIILQGVTNKDIIGP